MTARPADRSQSSEDLHLSDDTAVAQLLERFRPRLERMFVMRLDPRLAQRIDVDDVIQEAFVEVMRRLDDYRNTRPMPFFSS